MFAPRYFAPRYFAPRYFPVGIKVAEIPKGGIKPRRKWRFEEDLPYQITVEELELESDRLILQAYIDSLRKVEIVHPEKVEKQIKLSVVDSGYEDRKNKRRRMNDNMLLVMLIEEIL